MHSERQHAILSASSASRWLNCTPSAILEDAAGYSTSEYAEEGTTAHELAEAYINIINGIGRKSDHLKAVARIKASKFYTAEFDEYVVDYVEYVLGLATDALTQNINAIIVSEQRVDFSEYVPGGFGTADFTIINDSHVTVVDLKFGKGVAVYAKENSQLMLYALGVYCKYKEFLDLRTFRLIIMQPRLESITEYEIDVETLVWWAENVVKPAADLAIRGKGERRCGEWCKFCKVKPGCPAIAKQFNSFVKDVEHGNYSDDAILNVLAYGDLVADYISTMKHEALKRALDGCKWAGYKVVEGRSTRQFIAGSHEIVVEDLESQGYKRSMLYEEKPKPLTQLEKAVGKKKFAELYGAFVIKPPGAPALVREDDKRAEFVSNSADNYFDDLDV